MRIPARPSALLWFIPAFLLALIVALPAAFAEESGLWTLTTADFARHPVSLRGFDDKGVHVADPATPATPATSPATDAASQLAAPGERIIPFDHFLKIARPAARGNAATGKWVALLVSGDRLCGEPVEIKDEQLLFNCSAPGVGQIAIPMRLMFAIYRQPANPNDAGQRAEDKIILGNGDVMTGIVSAMADGKVQLQNADGKDPVPVSFDAVNTILFATTGGGKAPTERAFRIALTDSSLLTAKDATLDADEHLNLHLLDGAQRTLPLSAVASIEQLNGPVAWLSTLTPSAEEQASFSANLHWPARMDRSVTNQPIRVGGETIERGIGVHANSKLTWNLDGSFKAFTTRYAVDAAGSSSMADVNVRVLLDGKVVYEKKDVRAGPASEPIAIDLGDARTLTLEVTAAGATDAQDRVNWIEPALLREKPAR